ncbi:MAG: polyphosphate kinase 1 [Deltaproteobacteria bacterium]|nr:polyphosphate kinase 1 [Deltaproteobacteria bacterium]
MDQPGRFFNRELSWLEFNGRVLEEACDAGVPLAERLKFQAIVASNLDEFFMVRVAGLKQLVAGGLLDVNADGMLPSEQLAKISVRAHDMVRGLYQNWRDDIAPKLAQKAGIVFLRPGDLSQEQRLALETRFARDVWPVLTPLAVDQGHPFPVLRNRSLNLAILLHKERQRVARRHIIFAVVQVPGVLGRLVEVAPPQEGQAAFILLEDLIAMHVGGFFPGFRVVGCSPFRVTRNFDLSIDEDEADDLLKTIQRELRKRERGQAVRLEIASDSPAEVESFLRGSLRLDPIDVYRVDGPLRLSDLTPLTGHPQVRDFHDEPFAPQLVPQLREGEIFKALAERDVLLHHPYEAFDHVVDFVSEAADDPDVLAIKQTLYRTSAESPIVRTLIRAAENGKQVTAVVEIKARFDEGRNIAWARVLEESGVHVVYGLVGFKTHCKVSLVVRRERGAIRRYVHLSTGNYNPATARTYGDLSYMTAREDFADDAGSLFNLITGYSAPPSWKRFAIAPLGLKERVIELIAREAGFGGGGRIIAKMNALVDPDVIDALYRASQAGVHIELLVRGICCLQPGVPGQSENIRVTSVVDRFLEHARIFYFKAGGKQEVYLSSADWMPRNFVRRIEVMFPIDDKTIRDRVLHEILATQLADNVKARRLLADGTYERIAADKDAAVVRSQEVFIALARKRSQAGAAPSSQGEAASAGVPIAPPKPAPSSAAAGLATTPVP